MLMVSGTHVKVGAGLSTRIGLTNEQIEKIRNEARIKNAGKPQAQKKLSDRDFLIKDRPPILMIHILKTQAQPGGQGLDKCPAYLFAIGLGFPDTGDMKVANYVVNIQELNNWMEIDDGDEDE